MSMSPIKPRVLIVEDDPDLLVVLRVNLKGIFLGEDRKIVNS